MYTYFVVFGSNGISTLLYISYPLNERHLNECFNQTIPIKRRLTRYKHWFQDENVGDPIIDGTLVISIFRNPFEWVEAMRKKVGSNNVYDLYSYFCFSL
jgi:hypothetical protein